MTNTTNIGKRLWLKVLTSVVFLLFSLLLLFVFQKPCEVFRLGFLEISKDVIAIVAMSSFAISVFLSIATREYLFAKAILVCQTFLVTCFFVSLIGAFVVGSMLN